MAESNNDNRIVQKFTQFNELMNTKAPEFMTSDFKAVKASFAKFMNMLKKLPEKVTPNEVKALSDLSKKALNDLDIFLSNNPNEAAKNDGATPLGRAALLKDALEKQTKQFNKVIKAKNVTNDKMAKSFEKQSKELLEAAFAGKKTDNTKLKAAIVARKMAEKLKTFPPDGLFNEKFAALETKRLSKSKQVQNDMDNIHADLVKNLRADNTKRISPTHFFKNAPIVGGRIADKTENPLLGIEHKRLGLSTDRSSLTTIATAVLLRDGHSLKDVLDPNKLQAEKEKIGLEILDVYRNATDSQLATFVADTLFEGMQLVHKEMNSAFKKMPEITGQELAKPQNAHLMQAVFLLQDMGQELTVGPVKEKANQIFGANEVASEVSKQNGVCLSFVHIANAQTAIGLMAGGDPRTQVNETENVVVADEDLADNVVTDKITCVVSGALAENVFAEWKKNPTQNFCDAFADTTPLFQKACACGMIATNAVVEKQEDFKQFLEGDVVGNMKNLGNAFAKNNKLISQKDVVAQDGISIHFGDIGKKLKNIPHKSEPSAPGISV